MKNKEEFENENEHNPDFDREEDIVARDRLELEKDDKRSNKKAAKYRKEVALTLGGDLDFGDDDEEEDGSDGEED